MLKLYAIYCAGQPELKKRLDALKKDNLKFNAFLKVQQPINPSESKDRNAGAECRHLQLEDFLIMPLQRITRYPLLLERLLENTDSSVVSRCCNSLAEY